jgi:hypothetical protein
MTAGDKAQLEFVARKEEVEGVEEGGGDNAQRCELGEVRG